VKKFQFPLEKLMQWRQMKLDAAIARLERMLEEGRMLDEKRANLEGEVTESEAALTRATHTAGEEIAALDAFRRYAQRQQELLRQMQTELQARVESQRGAVVEARRQVELLEQIKADRLRGWRAELDREQEQMVAELVVARSKADWHK
jgi:hypothetical protein